MVAVAAGVAAATLLTASPTAGAHGSDAHLTVDQAHPAGSSTHYILKMTWDDGDPISGKVVTATPTGPDGTRGDPVTMQPFGDGQYQGLVPMPESGTWKVRFASTDPVAEVEATATMTAPTTTTSAQASATTAGATATTQTTPTTAGDDAAAATTTDDSDSSSSRPIIVGALVALLLVCGAAAILYRRANRVPDEPPLRSQ